MLTSPIIIAGGGISGMYCAMQLADAGHSILLLEASADRWGGRIETEEMDGFIAEYGPMRFEPTLQPRFAQLCKDLGVNLIDFSGPSAEEIPTADNDLAPEEQGLNSLQLLKRGIMLVMGRDPNDQAWIDSLSEHDFYQMRKHAQLHGQPLWNMGFWNALSSQGGLSHRALVKLRDTGTFYHMIPENLNAIEWIIWWLRALKTVGQELASIEGGSAKLTECMMERLRKHPNITCAGAHSVVGFRPIAIGKTTIEVDVQTEKGIIQLQTERLILALPRQPLTKLSPSLPQHISEQLDSVNGFPMLKIFIVTDKPWWDYDQAPQQYANCMPTREIHYFRRDPNADHDGHGMILLYMDRPNTEFWKHYVNEPKKHDRAEIDQNSAIIDAFSLYVARDVHRVVNSPDNSNAGLHLTDQARELFSHQSVNESSSYIKNSIRTYGIRDWAQAPYGAANHGWQPGVRSWRVMETFKAFDFGSGAKNIHIVGEAYSDYQGFIEGALNTCELALSGIAPIPKAEEVDSVDN
jgi:monoamine oxidase